MTPATVIEYSELDDVRIVSKYLRVVAVLDIASDTWTVVKHRRGAGFPLSHQSKIEIIVEIIFGKTRDHRVRM